MEDPVPRTYPTRLFRMGGHHCSAHHEGRVATGTRGLALALRRRTLLLLVLQEK